MTDQRGHAYRLRYDDGGMEEVTAGSPADAVRGRTRHAMPHTVTDMTVMNNWWRGLAAEKPSQLKKAVIHAEPGDY